MIIGYDGISLNNPPAWIVETFDESVDARGSNVVIPYRIGRIWQHKVLDERHITLGLLVAGTSFANLEENLDTLKKLFGTRKMKLLTIDMEGTGRRQQYAEVPDIPAIHYISAVAARMVVDFVLAEPLLRSDVQITNETVIDANPTYYTIVNPGTAEDYALEITLTGPLNYPKIYNLTSGVYLGYMGDIGAGNDVTIDCKNFTAMLGLNNVIGSIVHSGSMYFMTLLPGSNEIKVEDNVHTTGKIKISFYTPYL